MTWSLDNRLFPTKAETAQASVKATEKKEKGGKRDGKENCASDRDIIVAGAASTSSGE
jgi:hypothetical protein